MVYGIAGWTGSRLDVCSIGSPAARYASYTALYAYVWGWQHVEQGQPQRLARVAAAGRPSPLHTSVSPLWTLSFCTASIVRDKVEGKLIICWYHPRIAAGGYALGRETGVEVRGPGWCGGAWDLCAGTRPQGHEGRSRCVANKPKPAPRLWSRLRGTCGVRAYSGNLRPGVGCPGLRDVIVLPPSFPGLYPHNAVNTHLLKCTSAPGTGRMPPRVIAAPVPADAACPFAVPHAGSSRGRGLPRPSQPAGWIAVLLQKRAYCGCP